MSASISVLTRPEGGGARKAAQAGAKQVAVLEDVLAAGPRDDGLDLEAAGTHSQVQGPALPGRARAQAAAQAGARHRTRSLLPARVSVGARAPCNFPQRGDALQDAELKPQYPPRWQYIHSLAWARPALVLLVLYCAGLGLILSLYARLPDLGALEGGGPSCGLLGEEGPARMMRGWPSSASRPCQPQHPPPPLVLDAPQRWRGSRASWGRAARGRWRS